MKGVNLLGNAVWQKLGFLAVVLAMVFAMVPVTHIQAEAMVETDWVRQFGPNDTWMDWVEAVDADGNIYVAGHTEGTLTGESSAGGYDVFLQKYDSSGEQIWTRQFGSGSDDHAFGLCSDGTAVYVAGYTSGALPGQTSQGGDDAYLRKYDSEGNVLWTRQFGSALHDYANEVDVDATGVYVVGHTRGSLPGEVNVGGCDAFVRKYDSSGNVAWTDQFGSVADENGFGVAVGATGVYVIGSTGGVLPGQQSSGGLDVYVRKYDSSGNVAWTDQFGSAGSDDGYSICVDATGAYAAGWTEGALTDDDNAGLNDAFVRRYDAGGNVAWTDQFGTTGEDLAYGIDIDDAGIYVAGFTTGAFPDQSSSGGLDAFVTKYGVTGGEIWTYQFGTESEDLARAISVDDTGIYVAGITFGTFADGEGSGPFFVARVVEAGNSPPVIGQITAPTEPVEVNTEIGAGADFTDPDSEDSHTAVWEWGDGSISEVAAVDGYTGGSHTYTEAGVYTLTLTVTDDNGNSDEALYQYVVVYDPSAGFVTGGGWIDSPEGAYAPDPTLAGRANFGFVSKYKKGADVPTGHTEFHLNVAGFKFQSTSYQWLVVAGTKAKFKGWGTINGSGDYCFMLTAADGKKDDGVDTFRIKIWDASTDEVVYDNQMGDADDSEATLAISGGNIVVHTR